MNADALEARIKASLGTRELNLRRARYLPSRPNRVHVWRVSRGSPVGLKPTPPSKRPFHGGAHQHQYEDTWDNTGPGRHEWLKPTSYCAF